MTLARLALAIALVLVAPSAFAADGPATAHLTVVRHGAASACPGADALGRAIDDASGRDAIVDGGGDDRVGLTVTFDDLPGGGFRARLVATGSRAGERVIEDAGATTCAALAEGVAVATALLLDDRMSAAPEAPPVAPPAPPPEPPPPAPPPRPPPSPPLAAPPPAPEDPGDDTGAQPAESLQLGLPATWSVDAAVLLTTALVERGSVELGAWGRRRFGPVSVAAAARVMLPATVAFGNGEVELWSLRGAAEGCLNLSSTSEVATLSPCLTFAAGPVLAQGNDFEQTESAVQPSVSLGGALVVAVAAIGPTSVVVRGGASGAVVRPTFRVEQLGGAEATEVGVAHEGPAFAFDAGAGLRWGFR